MKVTLSRRGGGPAGRLAIVGNGASAKAARRGDGRRQRLDPACPLRVRPVPVRPPRRYGQLVVDQHQRVGPGAAKPAEPVLGRADQDAGDASTPVFGGHGQPVEPAAQPSQPAMTVPTSSDPNTPRISASGSRAMSASTAADVSAGRCRSSAAIRQKASTAWTSARVAGRTVSPSHREEPPVAPATRDRSASPAEPEPGRSRPVGAITGAAPTRWPTPASRRAGR